MSNGTLQKQGAGTLALTGSALTSPISYQLDDGTLSASGLNVVSLARRSPKTPARSPARSITTARSPTTPARSAASS